MGNTYEVLYYDYNEETRTGKYIPYWAGDDLFIALEQMQILKRDGRKCIQLVWRP